MKRAILILVLSLILVSGMSGCPLMAQWSQAKVSGTNPSINECISKCHEISLNKTLFSECILDPIPNTDSVCDVAHSPRTAEDNMKENQCQSYLNNTVKHFIELTPECNLIRASR